MNKIKIISTNAGAFNAEQLVAIALFLMGHADEVFEVIRTDSLDTGIPITGEALSIVYDANKIKIAETYLKTAFGKDLTQVEMGDRCVKMFTDFVYADLIAGLIEPPHVSCGNHVFTITELVKYMNHNNAECEEQDIDFHKTLSVVRDWICRYLTEVASNIVSIHDWLHNCDTDTANDTDLIASYRDLRNYIRCSGENN